MSMTETLRLVINGDSKGATRALDQIEKKAQVSEKALGNTGKQWNKAANVAAVGVVALGAVIGKSVKDYAEFGVTVAKVNAMTGLGAEATSQLVGQMEFFHADASKAGMVVKTLEKQLYGLETGAKAPTVAFKALGLTWGDLKNLKPEDQLALIRDRLSQVTDESTRTTVASTLLGRGAKDMSLWYTASADSVAKVNQQLQQNGQILNEGQLKDAEAAAVAWKNFSGAMKGVEYSIAQTALPWLTKLAQGGAWLLRTLRPLSPLLIPLVGILGTFVGVVKTAVFFQKTWGQLLGLLPARMGAAAVAEEGLAGATVAETGAMQGQIATLGTLGIALGAVALATWGIVKAYQSWKTAAAQAAVAAAGSKATDVKAQSKIDAWKAAHPGKTLPEGYQRLQETINNNPKDYQAPKNVHEWARSALGGMWDNTYGKVIKAPKLDVDTKLVGAKLQAAQAQVANLRKAIQARTLAGHFDNGPLTSKLTQAQNRVTTLRRQLQQKTKSGPLDLSSWLSSIQQASASLSLFRSEIAAGTNAMPISMHGPNAGKVPKKLASGGTVRARPGGTVVLAAEAGEDEDFVPKSKRQAYARGVLGGGSQGRGNVTIEQHLHFGTVVGGRAGLRELSQIVQKDAMHGVRRAMVGQNA